MFQIRSVDQPPPHPTKAYLHHLHCAGIMVEMPVEMGFSPHTLGRPLYYVTLEPHHRIRAADQLRKPFRTHR